MHNLHTKSTQPHQHELVPEPNSQPDSGVPPGLTTRPEPPRVRSFGRHPKRSDPGMPLRPRPVPRMHDLTTRDIRLYNPQGEVRRLTSAPPHRFPYKKEAVLYEQKRRSWRGKNSQPRVITTQNSKLRGAEPSISLPFKQWQDSSYRDRRHQCRRPRQRSQKRNND